MKQCSIYVFNSTLKFSQKTSVSNVMYRMIIFVCLRLAPRIYVVKFDSTVSKTGTTQILGRGYTNNMSVCLGVQLYVRARMRIYIPVAFSQSVDVYLISI